MVEWPRAADAVATPPEGPPGPLDVDGDAAGAADGAKIRETGGEVSLDGDAGKIESGRWSMAEHKRFVEGLEKFGRRKWIRIAQHVGTRTVIQVRSHAQKYFKKLRKDDDDPWRPPEAGGGLALLTAAAHLVDKDRPSSSSSQGDDAATVRVDRDERSSGSDDASYQLHCPAKDAVAALTFARIAPLATVVDLHDHKRDHDDDVALDDDRPTRQRRLEPALAF